MSLTNSSGFLSRPPMADINIVPLVDVMLVLLVIFIVTAPLLTHAVKVDLPKATSTPNVTQPSHVELAVRADGTMYWNGELVRRDQLQERLGKEALRPSPPEIHLRADKSARYEWVAQVIAGAKGAGLTRIGFVTEPGEARASPERMAAPK